MSAAGLLAVAIHDVEPATFERCALIRDWLDDLGCSARRCSSSRPPTCIRSTIALPGRRRGSPSAPGRATPSPSTASSTGTRRPATLAASYDWWATLGRVHRAAGGSTLSPALALDGASAPHRLGAPWLARLGAFVAGPVLRLDLHPGDLDRPRRIGAAEAVQLRSRRRVPVTYDDLA